MKDSTPPPVAAQESAPPRAASPLPATASAAHGRPLPARPRTACVLLSLALACALLAGCAGRAPVEPARPIADLSTFPQDATAYLDPVSRDLPLLPAAQQAELAADHLARFFAPWHRQWPEHGPEKVFALLDTNDPSVFHGENTLPRTPCWIDAIRALCDVDNYPNTGLAAIATVNTDMRVLPTHRPLFRDFRQAGEGFPFDYNQNTAVWAQTPLFVSHVSADGAWALVETHNAYGWLPMRDIAFVDEQFEDTYMTGRYAAFTRDFVPVQDGFGLHRFDGRVGMLLPVTGDTDAGFDVLIALRGPTGRAQLSPAEIGADDADAYPLRATPTNFARLTNAMIGQPYGWGGLYGNRDCSAMVVDLYAPFGIWQPRNSTQQAEHWGYADLSGLEREAKRARILAEGRPWLTLFWKRGHIMVYIGTYDGRPAILHTAWGLKTETRDGYGRHVIGATVVTGLEPGAELPRLARLEGNLLHALRGIARVAPGEGN